MNSFHNPRTFSSYLHGFAAHFTIFSKSIRYSFPLIPLTGKGSREAGMNGSLSPSLSARVSSSHAHQQQQQCVCSSITLQTRSACFRSPHLLAPKKINRNPVKQLRIFAKQPAAILRYAWRDRGADLDAHLAPFSPCFHWTRHHTSAVDFALSQGRMDAPHAECFILGSWGGGDKRHFSCLLNYTMRRWILFNTANL